MTEEDSELAERCEYCGALISDDGYSIDPDKACFYCNLDE